MGEINRRVDNIKTSRVESIRDGFKKIEMEYFSKDNSILLDLKTKKLDLLDCTKKIEKMRYRDDLN